MIAEIADRLPPINGRAQRADLPSRPEQAGRKTAPTPWPSLPLPTSQEQAQALMMSLGGLGGFREWLIQREELIELEKSDPLHYGYEPACWADADALMKDNDILVIMGGNRCLGGETQIYDPVLKRSLPVSEIQSDFHVHSWTGRRVVVAEARQPFRKEPQTLLKILLDDGTSFVCSESHWLLDMSGLFVPLGELPADAMLFWPVPARGRRLLKLDPKIFFKKIAKIKTLRRDWVWDFEVPRYHNYLCAGVVHHNSSKTSYASKRMVQWMESKEHARIWAVQTTESNSVAMQQPFVWHYLPLEWKTVKKAGVVTYISYTQKNGFSNNTFVAPNGSQAWFKNYAQKLAVVEGAELDLAWCDESAPVEWIQTLRFRLVTRNGKLLLTFTPAQGYSPTVAEFMNGAVVLKSKPAELAGAAHHYPGLPRGQVPYIMKAGPRWPNAALIFFHSIENPYNDYAALCRMLQGKTTVEILERAYGLATKTQGNVFQKFGPANIIPRSALPKEGTRYCVADGAGVKNWFIKWYLIDSAGRIYIYREWPDFQNYGEWALPGSSAEGKAGPAQRASGGRGIDEYKRIILEAEGWKYDAANRRWMNDEAEEIYERIIDPRFGSLSAPSGDATVNVISLMEEEERGLPALYWTRPFALKIDQRVQLLNQKLDWNMEEPLGPLNQPAFYVVDDCHQSICALQEYKACSNTDGRMTEATKDVIDCDGYLLCADACYVDTKLPICVGGGAY